MTTSGSDSIISGTVLKTLYADLYQSITDLADTTLIDSGYDHYISAIDLIWRDPSGQHNDISPLNIEIHVYSAVTQTINGSCVDAGWSVNDPGSSSCGTPAYMQFPQPLDNPDCNAYLGCVYTFGAPTDIYLVHLDIETKDILVTDDPTSCLTKAGMESLLSTTETLSSSSRPIAFLGSSKSKTILPNYSTYLALSPHSEPGLYEKVTYANCFHTWVERPLNPIFHPTQYVRNKDIIL